MKTVFVLMPVQVRLFDDGRYCAINTPSEEEVDLSSRKFIFDDKKIAEKTLQELSGDDVKPDEEKVKEDDQKYIEGYRDTFGRWR